MRNHKQEGIFSQRPAAGLVLALLTALSPVRLLAGQARNQAEAQAGRSIESPHRFFDRTNLVLFAGVAAVRTLDFTSTQHFRHNGHNEVMLTNSIVDNKPLFAGIEAAGVTVSIGVAYWLHRTGHHKLERWVSAVHIGIAATGDIHNYTLGPVR